MLDNGLSTSYIHYSGSIFDPGRGEREAIALVSNVGANLVVLDDLKGKVQAEGGKLSDRFDQGLVNFSKDIGKIDQEIKDFTDQFKL